MSPHVSKSKNMVGDSNLVWVNGVCPVMDQRPEQGLLLPLTWWPLCLADGRSLWWKLSRCWRRTDQTRWGLSPKVRKSCGRSADLLQVCDRHWFILLNLRTDSRLIESVKIWNQERSTFMHPWFHLSSEKIWMFQNFSLFFPHTGANQFPLECCLRFMGYLQSVYAWQVVTQDTRLQNCNPCLIFILFYVFWALQSFPKAEFHRVSKDTRLHHVVLSEKVKIFKL